MNLWTIIIILLVIGAFGGFGGYHWGGNLQWGSGGALGLVLIVVVLLLLFGRG